MDTVLIMLAFLLATAGLLGSFLPVLPGPPLAFAGLALLWFTNQHQPSAELLGMHLFAATAITLLDYYVPIYGTRRFGGTPAGTRGATVGLVIGLFFGPLGIIAGPFTGALLAELISGTPTNRALRSALGAFIAGVFMKLAYALVAFYHIFQSI
jgi:uncharacterized protein YqgC (DUF456 family)